MLISSYAYNGGNMGQVSTRGVTYGAIYFLYWPNVVYKDYA